MNALDLVEWVCAKGKCCRDIFVLYCVHNHRCVTVPIHITKCIGFPVYATRINMLDALRGFGWSLHEHVDMLCIHKHETLQVRRSAPNANLYQISAVKMVHPHCRILIAKAR